MRVSFMHPWFLVLLPIFLAAVILLSLKNLPKGFARGLFTTLRCAVFALLVLALSGANLVRFSDITTHIFVADISASVTEGAKDTVLSFIRQANAHRGARDSVGLVCFGENAVADSLPALDNTPVSITSYVDDGFTDMTEGLRLAQSLMPDDTKKHIILASDGLENLGDAVNEAKLLNERGITLDVLPIGNTLTEEVQLSSLLVPKTLKKETRYEIEVTGHALTAGSARLLLYKNNRLLSDTAVTFREGENNFVFSDVADENGGVIFRAEVLPETDTYYQNNIVYGYSQVLGLPGILVVDNAGSSEQIAEILRQAGTDVTVMKGLSVPQSLPQLSKYDGIVLPNVPLSALPADFPALVEAYVKNAGGGLLVTGGDESFGLGEYKDSPLETALPVNMELKDKDKQPNLGLVVVVDRSGSMGVGQYGVSKLELAKEAVIRSLETLQDQDYFGVIAFDDGYQWASNFQKVEGSKAAITDNIANISLGGGTSILPGLTGAYETLKNTDTKLKHIVLLTDGQAEQTGYDPIIAGMNEAGITLSTVAVGGDSDIPLLKRLSEKGKGRYYYSDEFTDLPQIFAKETFLAGKTFLNNEPFVPVVSAASPILSGVEALPAIGGYVSSTPKDRADIILISPKDEPVLAAWQYGLGRAVAYLSDVGGMWSAEWLASAEGVTVTRNMVSWALRTQLSTDIQLTARLAGENIDLSANLPYTESIAGLTAAVTAPDMTTQAVAFKAVAPGSFVAKLPGNREGAYLASVEIEKAAGTERIITGFSVPYSSEFDIRTFHKGAALLSRLASLTGGRVLNDPEEAYAAQTAAVYGQDDVTLELLVAALLLFLLDIFFRRFPAVTRKLELLLRRAFGFRLKLQKAPKPLLKKAEAAENPLKQPKKRSAEKRSEVKGGSMRSTSSALVSKKKKRQK